MTAAGGLEELAVRPPSGQSCGVSISAKPAGKEAKPAEPTTPAPGGMDSEKWASAEDWDTDDLEDDADIEDWTKPCEDEMEELEKIKAKLQSKMVTLSLEGAIWLKECAEATTQDSNGQAQEGKGEGNDGACDKLPQNEAEAEQGTLLRLPSRRHARKEGNDWARD